MFSVANFLDRAKARASIDSDYRLAKVIGISHGTMSGYRSGKSMPDERVIDQLCALSGDDPAVMAAQIQGERARTPEGKTMWKMIAARLSGAAGSAILSLVITMGLIAPDEARASTTAQLIQKVRALDLLYIVSNAVLSPACFVLVRLRQTAQGLPGICRLIVCAGW